MSRFDDLTIHELTDLLIEKVLVLAHHEYSNNPESALVLPSLRNDISEIQKEIIERSSGQDK